MNSFEAQLTANNEIIEALTACGLVDGVTLMDKQISSEKRIIFWNLTPTQEAAKKQTYITYELWQTPESQNNTRADNQPVAFSFTGNIDIFTRERLTNAAIRKLIGDICETLQNNYYLVAAGPDIYESDTGISHKPIEISKEIF